MPDFVLSQDVSSLLNQCLQGYLFQVQYFRLSAEYHLELCKNALINRIMDYKNRTVHCIIMMYQKQFALKGEMQYNDCIIWNVFGYSR